MKDFQFEQRPGVMICGKFYDADISDVGFLAAMIDSYAGMVSKGEELQKELGGLSASLSGASSLEKVKAVPARTNELNRELYETAKEFIVTALGEKAYREIFADRRPNSAEHVQVCGHIYQQVLEQRAGYVQRNFQTKGGGGNAGASKKRSHRGKSNPPAN